MRFRPSCSRRSIADRDVDQLPGVYEAKVFPASVPQAAFDVQVPQVHGLLRVPVSRYIGELPELGSMGIVSFIGGASEWPVWLGASNG